jgi:ADP-dependent NAD(P)H-hydrate dehydratase / NAD(P)H-hydrate epimerase
LGFLAQTNMNRQVERKLPPLVIDADGLKLLTKIPEWWNQLPRPAILTPHPGEMAILSGLSVEDIQSNRVEITEKFAQKWGHVVVLKGANTIISNPDGRTALIPVATPALAHAGTGDVLAGIISGLRAQGVGVYESAFTGAWIHAQAGLMAAKILGNTASVLAGDVLQAVIEVISNIERKYQASG